MPNSSNLANTAAQQSAKAAAPWLMAGCPKNKSRSRRGAETTFRKIAGPVPAALAAKLPLVAGDEVLDNAPVVTLSEQAVTVEHVETNRLTRGVFNAQDKRDGPDGYFVDGLFRRLQSVARRLKNAKQRRCFLLAAAKSIPYFTVASVLYTAVQAGFRCYQIAVLRPPESRATLTAIKMSFPPARFRSRGHKPAPVGSRLEDAWGRTYYASPAHVHRSATRDPGGGGTLFGQHLAVSSEEEEALGALMGHTVGDDSGLGGLGKGGKGGSGVGGTGFGGWGGFGKGGGDSLGIGLGGGKEKLKSRQPRVFMSRASVSGGLDAATIRRVVRHHLSEIKYCYLSIGLHDKPDLAGMVKVSWTIKPSGSVGQVSVVSSTLSHPATERCIKSAVKRWRFPKPDGSMPFITYPFHFKPKG